MNDATLTNVASRGRWMAPAQAMLRLFGPTNDSCAEVKNSDAVAEGTMPMLQHFTWLLEDPNS